MWMELWDKLKEAEHKDLYNNRKKIWFSKFTVAAYMMHPKFKGNNPLKNYKLNDGYHYLIKICCFNLQVQD